MFPCILVPIWVRLKIFLTILTIFAKIEKITYAHNSRDMLVNIQLGITSFLYGRVFGVGELKYAI